MSNSVSVHQAVGISISLLLVALTIGCGQFPASLDGPLPLGRFAKDNVDVDPQFQTARRLEREGKLDEAIAKYQEIVQEQPKRSDAHHRLAVTLDKADRHEESADHYLSALRLDSRNPEFLCDYGYSRYLQGDLDEAHQVLRRATRLREDFPRAHNNLGLVLTRLGNDEEALASFRLAGLSDAESHNNLKRAQERPEFDEPAVADDDS